MNVSGSGTAVVLVCMLYSGYISGQLEHSPDDDGTCCIYCGVSIPCGTYFLICIYVNLVLLLFANRGGYGGRSRSKLAGVWFCLD